MMARADRVLIALLSILEEVYQPIQCFVGYRIPGVIVEGPSLPIPRWGSLGRGRWRVWVAGAPCDLHHDHHRAEEGCQHDQGARHTLGEGSAHVEPTRGEMDVHCWERETALGWWWWCLAKPCWGSLLGSQQGAEGILRHRAESQ